MPLFSLAWPRSKKRGASGKMTPRTRCITWAPWIMITRTIFGCKWWVGGWWRWKSKLNKYPKPLQNEKNLDEAHVPQFRAPYPLPCHRRRTDYNTLHSSLNNSNNGENDQTAIFELAQRVDRKHNNHNLHIRLQGLQQPHSPCFHSAILPQNALNFLLRGSYCTWPWCFNFLIHGWHHPFLIPFDIILYWLSCVVRSFRQTEVLLRPHIETILRQFSAQQPANRKPLLASNRARMLWEIIQLGATTSLPITEILNFILALK